MATNNAINLNSSGIVSYDSAGTFTALANPLTVANGGTGIATNTAYAVICAGTTSTGALQNVSGVGTAGQVLTSAGAGALPTWSNPGGFTLYWGTTSGNPGDASTYYFVNGRTTISFTTPQSANCILIPKNCTLTSVYVLFSCTAGTNEAASLYIRKNLTSDTTISTTLNFSTNVVTASATAIGLSLSAGDYLIPKFVTPTWVTNPGNVRAFITAYCI